MKHPMTTLLICLAIANLAGAATLDEKGFILDWLLSGPYPSYVVDGKPRGLDQDLLPGGEINANPTENQKATATFKADKARLIAGIGSTNEWGFKEDKTFDTTWKVHSFKKNIIELDQFAQPIDDHFVVYAITWIEAQKDQDVKVRVGSDDDHKIWLNGQLLGRVNSSQGIVPDNFIYDAKLQHGTNKLLIKVVDRTHGCGFCVAITDRDGKPCQDITIHPQNPLAKHDAQAYNNGYSAQFNWQKIPLFTGENTLKIKVFNQNNPSFKIRFNASEKQTQSGQELEFPVDLKLGKQTIQAQVLEGENLAAVLQIPVVAYSEEQLQKENEELQRQIDALDKQLPQLKKDLDKAKKRSAEAKKALLEAFKERERKYRTIRAKATKNANKSIDEPMPKRTTKRKKICINGFWQISFDKKEWFETHLPQIFKNDWHRIHMYPLYLVKKGEIYGPVASLKGWEDFTFNPIFTKSPLWFKKTIQLKSGETTDFICENIDGKAEFFLNGNPIGDYYGHIGIVRIPLANPKDGDNLLEIKVTRLEPHEFGPNRVWGLRGNIFLETKAPLHVADVWVKTSWRNATVSVQTEIQNRSNETKHAKITQYIAENGRIRLRLPEQSVEINPGKTATVKTETTWANPKCWGIGGKYAGPNLYELITELDDDRHSQTFGFREFWIHSTDFYLNGKRIVLQGDVGACQASNIKMAEVVWPLFRYDGINTIRIHDNDSWDPQVAKLADRTGMLYYAQMYPKLHDGKATPQDFIPYEQWFENKWHAFNLKQYDAWFKMLRNNPSVVIWSTDNEILTQAWDTTDKVDYNVRNDRLGAFYGKYVKSLDSDLVMTRDGDVGTWNRNARWYEDPPCDTANYHYPDFNVANWVVNWQKVYEYRPVIYGETLYYSYGAWDNWIGPIPSQVEKKARRVAEIAKNYRELQIPGIIYMGLGSDGFCGWDDTGKGSPWGITRKMTEEYDKDKTLPPGLKADQYPRYRIKWPAHSGLGYRQLSHYIHPKSNGAQYNWFDSSTPSHVRNAVNDAYRDNLIPQPPLVNGADAECIVKALPNTPVWATTQTGEQIGVLADNQGLAWFKLDRPGTYVFTAKDKDGNEISAKLKLKNRKKYAAKPGFEQIQKLNLVK